MSDISFTGVDFSSFFDENFQKDLAAYFATPEGQANLAASGLAGLGDTGPQPVTREQPR